MVKPDLHKLYRKFLVLAILIGGLAFLSSGRNVYAYGAGDDGCIQQYNSCTSMCPIGGDAGTICEFGCLFVYSGCTPQELPQPE